MDNLSDNVTSTLSNYFFNTTQVKAVIRRRGGLTKIAALLDISERTLYRTLANTSRNGRLQRDIVRLLRKKPEDLGYFKAPSASGSESGVTSSGVTSLAASAK